MDFGNQATPLCTFAVAVVCDQTGQFFGLCISERDSSLSCYGACRLHLHLQKMHDGVHVFADLDAVYMHLSKKEAMACNNTIA